MAITVKQFHELIGVTESFKAPETLMNMMLDREVRETLFKRWLLLDNDTTHDQFHDYFEEEQAERKKNKQDFTPDSISNLLSSFTNGHNYFEPAAGTGGIAIKYWWNHITIEHSPLMYFPSEDIFVLEELSERALPFLLFNLAIRGMNAIVINGDSLDRTARGIFYILNEKDDWMGFSTINVMPYSNAVANEFNVTFTGEKYPDHIEADIEVWKRNINNHADEISNIAKRFEKIKDL